MIDWTKPIETTDGLPATLVYISTVPTPDPETHYHQYLVVVPDGDDESARWFDAEGNEVDEDFVLRNVAV